MADVFEERKKSEEAKYKLNEERRFKAEARCNKLLGFWAAHRMGLPEYEAEAYAREVVTSTLEEPGVEAMIRKIVKDLQDESVVVDESAIREELGRLYPVALDEITREYPEALGPDHERVGD